MDAPRISVIIPAYNNAGFLGDAMRSVLGQTHEQIELIVVNDASPDEIGEVVRSFDDPRIKYIVHERNRGLSAARNTGIRNSKGDYIALLDGDDYFHTDKLKAHVDFLQENPDISVTYNARFELNHSAETIREIWRPPLAVDISDLVLGYPFSPSDMVVRRDRLFEAGLFDEGLTYFGEDLDINCKLALIGCRFASVDRVLNYRRFHSRRTIQNLPSYKNDELRALDRAFEDRRFPDPLQALHNKAVANRLVGWSILAFVQEDGVLGREYGREAVRLHLSLLAGTPNDFIQNILGFSILDENLEHEAVIRGIVNQLPLNLKPVADQADWAISRGYLIRACRAVLWGRSDEGKSHFAAFSRRGGRVDMSFLRQLCSQIYNYEMEFGLAAAYRILGDLSLLLQGVGARDSARQLKSEYPVTRAFRNFEAGEYSKVPGAILRSIAHDPSHLLNRGVIKMFFKSLANFSN